MTLHNYRYMLCSNHLALLDVAITFLLMLCFCLFENTILEYRLLFYSLTLLLSPGVQKAFLHVQDNVSRNFIIDMQVWEKCNVILLVFFLCVHLVALFALWSNKRYSKVMQDLKKKKRDRLPSTYSKVEQYNVFMLAFIGHFLMVWFLQNLVSQKTLIKNTDIFLEYIL